jgi:CHAT domain-containing protein
VCDSDEIQSYISSLHETRHAGGLTGLRVQSLYREAQELTGGAVADAARCEPLLRDLRRMLFTLAYDAGLWRMAETLLELARPPELCDPADRAYAPASLDERIKWRSSQAMLLDAIGEADQAREAFMRLGEDYLAHDRPDEARFAVLTNAVQSAYELGDYAIGESLLVRAERLARGWTSDSVRLNLALARLHPPVSTCDIRQFRERYAEAAAVVERVAPALIPQLDRFAVLAALQMGMPSAAAEWLPASPLDTATEAELVTDTLVRLQVQSGLGHIDEGVVALGLSLLGHEASRSQEAALIGVLAIALFRLGKTGPAVLLATLFLRDLDAMIATLPRNPQMAHERRRNTLQALRPLRAALVMGGYLRAAEEVAGVEAILTHRGTLPPGRYRKWAPGKTIGQAAAKLADMLGKAREGQVPSETITAWIMGFKLPSPLPLRAEHVDGQLNLTFLAHEGRLVLIHHARNGAEQTPIGLSSEELAELVQNTYRALRKGSAADTERTILGKALFGPVATQVASANSLHIAAFGPVANLPFACIPLDGDMLCQGRRLTIRTCVAQSEGRRRPPRTGLNVLFASGGDLDSLSHVSREAHAIAELYDVSDRKLIAEFGKNDLAAALAAAPEILHIAGHFHMPDDDLGTAAVIGAGGKRILLSEVFEPPVDLTSTKLVFLSGCDSAGHGGGRSLAAQINALGVRYVIATLWPVDDVASAEMATLVHQGIAQGLVPDAALSRAVHALRAVPAFSHPRHWAAFQCYQA